MKRFIISGVDSDEEKKLYRTVLSWVVAYADQFIIFFSPELYTDPFLLQKINTLGPVTTKKVGPPADIKDSNTVNFLGAIFGKGEETLHCITGIPDHEWLTVMTTYSPPEKAIAGDLSPVEEITLSRKERKIYKLFDYGRTQILELNDQELNALIKILTDNELDPGYIMEDPFE